MKKIIFMTSIFVFTLACSRGKAMVVTAESGLRFHTEPKLDATVLELLPNGTHVKVLQAEGPQATIDNITANWMEAEVHEKKGWLFGGYLSEDPVFTSWEIREDQLWIRTRSELSDPKSLVSCQITFQENVVIKTCPPDRDGVVYPSKYKKDKGNTYHFIGECGL